MEAAGRRVGEKGELTAVQGSFRGCGERLALAATRYSLFLTEYPKTNVDVTNQLRFGLSEPGRFQLYLNASVRRELWHDFFIGGSLYDSYDNRPPASSTLKNDVGVRLTLGWSF